jgi:hypothetical protein
VRASEKCPPRIDEKCLQSPKMYVYMQKKYVAVRALCGLISLKNIVFQIIRFFRIFA